MSTPGVHHGGQGDGRAAAWAVRVWEPSPPAGAEPLEWLLLTGEGVSSPGALRRVVGCYECRAVVEEFHKERKTGAGWRSYGSRAGRGWSP